MKTIICKCFLQVIRQITLGREMSDVEQIGVGMFFKVINISCLSIKQKKSMVCF